MDFSSNIDHFNFSYIDMIYIALLALVVLAIWLIVVRMNRLFRYFEKLEQKLEKGLFRYVKHVDEKNDLLAEALAEGNKRHDKLIRNQGAILKTLKKLVEK